MVKGLHPTLDRGIVAGVIERKAPESGDTLSGNLPWPTFTIEKAGQIRKIDTNIAPQVITRAYQVCRDFPPISG